MRKKLGFAWTQDSVVSDPYGHSITINPDSASIADLRSANGRRVAECHRYYSTPFGILTELRLKRWLAGGDAECLRFIVAVRQLLEAAPANIPLARAISELGAQGFADSTIGINFCWLIRDGYLTFARDGGQWVIGSCLGRSQVA